MVSVEDITPPAEIATLVPAVNALTTLAVSVTSAEASIAFNLEWSALVKLFCDNSPSCIEYVVLVKDVMYPALFAIWLLSVTISSCRAIVPLAFGNLIDLSAVGFIATKVVSLASAVVPSNTTPLDVSITATLLVVVVPATVILPGKVIVSDESPNVALPPKEAFKELFTLAVSVTSAEASIASNLEWSVSVKLFCDNSPSCTEYVVLVSVPVITPVVLLYDTAPAPLNLDLTCAVDNCVLVVVSVELIVPSAAICTLVPAVRAPTTFAVSVTSAEASIPVSLVFSAVVKFFCVNPPSPTVYVVFVSV